jgi:hypothetical protein
VGLGGLFLLILVRGEGTGLLVWQGALNSVSAICATVVTYYFARPRTAVSVLSPLPSPPPAGSRHTSVRPLDEDQVPTDRPTHQVYATLAWSPGRTRAWIAMATMILYGLGLLGLFVLILLHRSETALLVWQAALGGAGALNATVCAYYFAKGPSNAGGIAPPVPTESADMSDRIPNSREETDEGTSE